MACTSNAPGARVVTHGHMQGAIPTGASPCRCPAQAAAGTAPPPAPPARRASGRAGRAPHHVYVCSNVSVAAAGTMCSSCPSNTDRSDPGAAAVTTQARTPYALAAAAAYDIAPPWRGTRACQRSGVSADAMAPAGCTAHAAGARGGVPLCAPPASSTRGSRGACDAGPQVHHALARASVHCLIKT